MKDKRAEYWIKLLILFSAYFVTARIGLSLHPVSGFATYIWPPSGIALVGILVWGYRFWPAVALAAFLINLITGASPFVAAGIALGNTLEPLLGTYLLKRFVDFKTSLKRVKDVVGLVVYSALISTAFSATIGATSLLIGNTLHNGSYGKTWLAWWVGDMLGILIVAPVLFVWKDWHRTFLKKERLAEAVIVGLLLTTICVVVFRGFNTVGVKPFTLDYIIFPILIWIAVRFGQSGSVAATALVSVISIWGTIVSSKGNNDTTLSHDLLLLQSFMAVTAVTFMVVAAVVAERVATQKKQLQLAKRTATLTKQRAHLIALNQAKDEFISLASHQLRTPPTVIKQYSGLMLNNIGGKLSAAQKQMLARVYSSNERQIKVINDLLNVAQIDVGNVELTKQKIDIAQLIEAILEDKATTFENNNQSVSFNHNGGKFVANADGVKLGMVLENIIDNASKYTPKGKKIAIDLEKLDKDLSISVKDEGIGIAKQDTDKLFKKFSRIRRSTSISTEGTGLGLYWAKKIINLHGGSISVDSKPDSGSVFTIILPTGG